jgi:membrane protease YdiL (CAAX protease family)
MGSQFEMILRNPFGYLVIGLMAPLAEEIVFRGAILRSLLKWTSRHWLAIALSALCFALVHANPAQMPHAFLVGLLLGWMYYRTGSIIPCVTYHWVNNSVAYIMCNMMPDPDIPLIVFFNGSERAVIVALLSSLCILIPSILQLNLRMKKS